MFFISHIFFLTAFVALLAALIVVLIRQRRDWRALVLVAAPIFLIFLTAYLGKHAPDLHQAVNVVYDGLLIFNAYYFWRMAQFLTAWLYGFAIVSTGLDFAMHFVIRAV